MDVPLTLGFVVPYSVRPVTGFLFDFEPGVDIIFEEPFLGLREMPHLVDVLDFIAQLDRFVQLGGVPRTGQDSLVIGVSAVVDLSRGDLTISSSTQTAHSGKVSLPPWR